MMTPPPDAMPVYVTAKQWMWKFAYPDGRSSIDVLTVPVGRPIKLVMTSRDVIHSFYVPAFRMKHDVVPGRYFTAWFEATTTGVFAIDCAEYCGVSHSRMLGAVARALGRGLRALARDARAAGATAATSCARGARRRRAARCLAATRSTASRTSARRWAGSTGRSVTLDDGRDGRRRRRRTSRGR